jgi:siroheme synthase-like protein
MLDVTDRLVVIIGGGVVASRKAAGVLEAGATRVRCVSPVFDPEMPPGVERVEATYEPAHLDGAGLVFAATDLPAVNDAVVRDARSRGVLVSRADADDQDPGDFTVPAKWRSGPATLAVSAGGSPALAAMVRDRLSEQWDPRWTRMAEVMAWVRPRLRDAATIAPTLRREILRDLASDEAIEVLGTGGVKELVDWVIRRHPGFSKVSADGGT